MAQYKKYIENVIQSPRAHDGHNNHKRMGDKAKMSRSKDVKNKLYSPRNK